MIGGLKQYSWFLLTLGLPGLTVAMACAQDDQQQLKKFNDLLNRDQSRQEPEYRLQGNFTIEKGTDRGRLNIILEIKEGWHGFSMAKIEGQAPTQIEVRASVDYKTTGPFVADKQPNRVVDELGNQVEQFTGRVVFSAPIQFTAKGHFEDLTIAASVKGQVCGQSCIPFWGERSKVSAKFSKYTVKPNSVQLPFATVTAETNGNSIPIDGKFELKLSMALAAGWHVYQFDVAKPSGVGPQPTIIYFTEHTGFSVSRPKASSPANQRATGLPELPHSFEHDGTVDWTFSIQADHDTEPGKYNLVGRMLFQLCSEQNCEPPVMLEFDFPVIVADANRTDAAQVNLKVRDGDRNECNKQSQRFWEQPTTGKTNLSRYSVIQSLFGILALVLGTAAVRLKL